MINKATVIASVAAVAGLAFGAPAGAVPISFNGAVFNVYQVGSGTNYQIWYVADFTGISNNSGDGQGQYWDYYAGGVSLKMPGTVTINSLTTNAGGNWATDPTGQINANGCGDGAADALCAFAQQGSTLTKLNGQSLYWKFDVTFANAPGAITNSDLKFLSTDGVWQSNPNQPKNDGWNKIGSLVSIELNYVCCGTPPPDIRVPEPGTLALLGLGLLGLGVLRRRELPGPR